jgi:hypothetical protein
VFDLRDEVQGYRHDTLQLLLNAAALQFILHSSLERLSAYSDQLADFQAVFTDGRFMP